MPYIITPVRRIGAFCGSLLFSLHGVLMLLMRFFVSMLQSYTSFWSVLFLFSVCFHAFHWKLSFSVLGSNSYNNEMPVTRSRFSAWHSAENIERLLVTIESSPLARSSPLLIFDPRISLFIALYLPQLENINTYF